MNPQHQALWQQLAAFEVSAAADALSFCQRLARDNGWSLDYAQRVFEEYKKFLLLCAVGGHPMTPSDEVDQAWHLHLLYTRSYWDTLCGEILGQPLHHQPTRGGRSEGQKFHAWYHRTLTSYQTLFGTAPPADIWPDVTTRFATPGYFKRLNTRAYWLLPRQTVATGLRWLALGGLSAVALSACTGGDNQGLWTTLLIFAVPLLLITQLIRKRTRRNVRKYENDSGFSVDMWFRSGHSGHHRHNDKDDDKQNDSPDHRHSGDSGCSSNDSGGDSGCGGSGCGGGD